MRDDTAHPSSPETADSPDGPCFYCGEPTSHYAGNPGLWPLRFCQRDGTGITRYHHTHCVTDRLNAHAPATALRRIEQDLRMYAAGLPDGDDLRSVLELAANDAASALRNAPAQRALPDQLELAQFLCSEVAAEPWDELSQPKYLADADIILAFLSPFSSMRAPAQTQLSHQVPSITEAMVDAGIAAATANPTRTLDANVLAILAAALAVSPTVAQRVTDEHHMTPDEVVVLMNHWQARALAAEAANAQSPLTEDQQYALERMAGHGLQSSGLTWDNDRLLIQSAAQAAKDVLSAFTSTEAPARRQPSRSDKGRAFYLAMYEKDGAIWAANDHKELWCDMAEDYERRLSTVTSTEWPEPIPFPSVEDAKAYVEDSFTRPDGDTP